MVDEHLVCSQGIGSYLTLLVQAAKVGRTGPLVGPCFRHIHRAVQLLDY